MAGAKRAKRGNRSDLNAPPRAPDALPSPSRCPQSDPPPPAPARQRGASPELPESPCCRCLETHFDLSPRQATVIVRLFDKPPGKEPKLSEVARAMGMRYGTFKIHLYRALGKAGAHKQLDFFRAMVQICPYFPESDRCPLHARAATSGAGNAPPTPGRRRLKKRATRGKSTKK